MRFKFVKKFFLLPIFILSLTFIFSKNVFAAISVTQDPTPVTMNSQSLTLTFHTDAGTFTNIENYYFGLWAPGMDTNNIYTMPIHTQRKVQPVDSITFKLVFNFSDPLIDYKRIGRWNYKIWSGFEFDASKIVYSGSYYMYPPTGPGGIGFPELQILSPVQENTQQTLTIANIAYGQDYTIYFDGEKNTIYSNKLDSVITKNDKNQNIAQIGINVGDAGQKRICLTQGTSFLFFGLNCDFFVDFKVTVLAPISSPTLNTSGSEGIPNEQAPPPPPPCAEGYFKKGSCLAVDTAIGNISTDPAKFVQTIFTVVLGLAGGIALILIIISGYKFMVSQGNPEAVKGATEQLTSAIIGLLFIIFAFVILQIIGVDILQIPGFSK